MSRRSTTMSHFVLFFHVILLCEIFPNEAKELQCSNFKYEERFDCFPGKNANKAGCLARSCCWFPVSDNKYGVPNCYYPQNYPSYNMLNLNRTSYGFTAILKQAWDLPNNDDLSTLRLDVIHETESRLRIQLTDPLSSRWEVPIPLDPPSKRPLVKPEYRVDFACTPFGIKVTRNSDKAILFDTISVQAPIRYSDQFLQISTRTYVNKGYGMGEHRGPLMNNLKQWMVKAFWTRDQPPKPGVNLYGVHNFFLGLDDSGSAYGIFFLNSNAHEIAFQPLPAMTYRTIGGILDFFIFTGPDPSSVVQQYLRLVGYPMLPAYWMLGFQLSRFGLQNITDLENIYDRNRNAHIPLDVVWNDIDYMENYLDWTVDQSRYAGLPEFIRRLQQQKTHYVILVDPAISNAKPGKYRPYDDGLKLGVFVNDSSGSKPLVGKMFPGNVVFADFTHPNAFKWWYSLASDFHETIKFEGLCIDANEPSNFVKGSLTGCTKNKLDSPPYTPAVEDGDLSLHTLCPSAQHYLSTHYNVHSLYAYYEAKVTYDAMHKLRPNRRVFLVSRSSFSGVGRYTFHWTGDNSATWDDMLASIPEILNFNIFGIPMVGADICGFRTTAPEELCVRWMQLGSFYPFMRNHNDRLSKPHDPASWSASAQSAMRKIMEMRYTLLPYMYTLFHRANQQGDTVVRPLFFEFPTDIVTHGIDRQFMLGSMLLISPVLAESERSVSAYLPNAVWYDAHTGQRLTTRQELVTLSAPLDTINVHIRGGSILPLLPPALTTYLSRKGLFGLAVYPDVDGNAMGELIWDDGETMEAETRTKYTRIAFRAILGYLEAVSVHLGYTAEPMRLGQIDIFGCPRKPDRVTVNDFNSKFTYNATTLILKINPFFEVDLTQTVRVEWI